MPLVAIGPIAGVFIAGAALAAASWFFTDIRHLESLAAPTEAVNGKGKGEIPIQSEKTP